MGAGIGSVVPGPGTLIGAGIGALVMIGAGIWYMTRSTDSTQEKVKEKDDCPNKCNPCKTVSGKIIAVGTFGYRPLDVIPDNEMQHGVYGSHHNIFQANQSPYPKCICFWAKQKYVLKPEQLTSSMVPIEPFLNSP
ncbi:hypothetical protein LL998_01395 [Burkholderia ambifaria]|nr:hypothetical protein [Burkholderia ambifaria]UEP36352.1 hypothetical protein LL998_01395 [Burkholderia ambifaria]